MPDKDDLDLLLDSALATYADPGPDSGLEQRLLSALAAERQSAEDRKPSPWPRRRLTWAIAVPVVASLLFSIGIEKFRHPPSIGQQQASESHPSPSSQGSQLASATAPPAHGALKTHDIRSQRKTRIDGLVTGHDFSHAENATPPRGALAAEGCRSPHSIQQCVPLPKLAVFPSPQPLTAEEQVLVAAASRGSDAQRAALLEAAKPPSDALLAIADLSIPPLVPPDEGTR